MHLHMVEPSKLYRNTVGNMLLKCEEFWGERYINVNMYVHVIIIVVMYR